MEAVTVIWAALGATCALYAWLLERLDGRYIPDYLILTVIVGNGFIAEALAIIEHFGTPLNAILVVETMAVAGLPIGVWQGIQLRRRKRETSQA